MIFCSGLLPFDLVEKRNQINNQIKLMKICFLIRRKILLDLEPPEYINGKLAPLPLGEVKPSHRRLLNSHQEQRLGLEKSFLKPSSQG